jgi:dTDP-4-amino-4,6-dideoxygalactose transaminase
MDAINAIAERHGIVVVEDNAHGLFAKYRGRWLGTFGSLATQSFHETKNITCGEGGALLINDERFVERAEIIRENDDDVRLARRSLGGVGLRCGEERRAQGKEDEEKAEGHREADLKSRVRN